MNKTLYRKIITHSLPILFLIAAPLIHPHVHYIVLLLIFFVLLRISSYDSEKANKMESVSISKKGLMHAAIATPFLLIFGFVVMLGMSFGISYLDNLIGKKSVITLLYGGLILTCVVDIFFLIRKDRKKT